MFWGIVSAAAGVAIGHELLERIRKKNDGKVPWKFTAAIWLLIAVIIYLGMQSLSPNPPDWMR